MLSAGGGNSNNSSRQINNQANPNNDLFSHQNTRSEHDSIRVFVYVVVPSFPGASLKIPFRIGWAHIRGASSQRTGESSAQTFFFYLCPRSLCGICLTFFFDEEGSTMRSFVISTERKGCDRVCLSLYRRGHFSRRFFFFNLAE